MNKDGIYRVQLPVRISASGLGGVTRRRGSCAFGDFILFPFFAGSSQADVFHPEEPQHVTTWLPARCLADSGLQVRGLPDPYGFQAAPGIYFVSRV